MPRRTRLIALAVVTVVAVGLVAAGCGSKPKSAAEWADGFCSAVTTWKTSIKSSGESLKSGSLSQDSIKSAAGDVRSATDTLESDLKDLGKPNIEAGQQAQDLTNQLSSDLKTGADSIKSATDDISSLATAGTAAATIGTTLATMANQVSSTFTSLKQLKPKSELQTAFQQSSACKQLTSSS
jgi:maltose-binding protein MalE